jgi:hypothetical protein
VYGVAFSPDGVQAATASADGSARVFDAATGSELVRLDHDGPVYSVAFSPDGTLVASAGADGTVRLWGTWTGAPRVWRGHSGPVDLVTFSPDGTKVVSAGQDGTVRLWDTADLFQPGSDEPVAGSVGRVLADGRAIGSAFALAPDIAVTAAHVLQSVSEAGGTLTYLLEGGELIPVVETEVDQSLDAAVLHLAEPAPGVLRPSPLVERGADCLILARPAADVPATITEFVYRDGYPVGALLTVNRDPAQLDGYSGSPVVLAGSPDQVIGVLQGRTVSAAERPEVLAVLIQPVVDRFGLPGRNGHASAEQLLELPLVEGALPRVRDVNPNRLGTAPSGLGDVETSDIPYVPRDVDAQLRQALNDHQFVLVTGPAKAGKTRTALEAARAAIPDASLVTPRPGALTSLVGHPLLRRSPGRLLIWLDDLDRFLAPPERLDRALLALLLGQRDHTVVLATVNAQRLGELRSGRDDVSRLLLDEADVIFLAERTGEAVHEPGGGPPATLHLSFTLDPKRPAGRRRATVQVRISREPPQPRRDRRISAASFSTEAGISAQESVLVDPDRPLVITANPGGILKVDGADRAQIQVPSRGAPVTVGFALIPTRRGRGQVRLIVGEGESRVTFRLSLEVWFPEFGANQSWDVRVGDEKRSSGRTQVKTEYRPPE